MNSKTVAIQKLIALQIAIVLAFYGISILIPANTCKDISGDCKIEVTAKRTGVPGRRGAGGTRIS